MGYHGIAVSPVDTPFGTFHGVTPHWPGNRPYLFPPLCYLRRIYPWVAASMLCPIGNGGTNLPLISKFAPGANLLSKIIMSEYVFNVDSEEGLRE